MQPNKKKKEIWNCINQNLTRKKVVTNHNIALRFTDGISDDPQEVSNHLAEYFSSITKLKLFEAYGRNMTLPATTRESIPQTILVYAVV